MKSASKALHQTEKWLSLGGGRDYKGTLLFSVLYCLNVNEYRYFYISFMEINPNLKNIYRVHYAAQSAHVPSLVLGSCQ